MSTVNGQPATATDSAQADDLRPWFDRVNWQADPMLAYVKGLQDGIELGREQVDREVTAALALALSAGGTTDYGTAVRVHHGLLDQLAARRRTDRREVAA